MKRYMFFLLFSAWLLSGSEIKLSRQALPRSNSIRIGDVNITVDRDDSSPSKWTIHAQRRRDKKSCRDTRRNRSRLVSRSHSGNTQLEHTAE